MPFRKVKKVIGSHLKTRRGGVFAAVFLLLLLASFLGFFYRSSLERNKAIKEAVKIENQDLTKKKAVVPSGSQDYKIIQPKDAWPKILGAKIDPPDVHIGDIQKFSIAVFNDVPIVSVEADIETDNGNIKVPLSLVKSGAGLPAAEPLYALSDNDVLKDVRELGSITDNSSAVEAAPGSLTYAGSWKVRDTHDTTYHTTFIVTDSLKRKNSITIAWTDACGIPNAGSWTLSGDCVISSADGVDGGNVVIPAGSTLTLNSSFVYNPGNNIIINGALALGASGSLKKTYLWQIDADNDNYAASATQYAQDTAPAGGRRRSLLVTAQYDCNDASNTVYPGVTTSSGSCSCGSYASTCAESVGGSQSYTYCSTNGTYTSGSSGCTCTRSTTGTSCGTTSYGTCSPSSTCSGSGTQSQTTYTCSSGSCASSSTSVSCSVTPAGAGTSCGTTSYGAWGSWGSCTGSGSCPTSGTQSRLRSMTTYACNGSGSCVGTAGTDSESQSCSIDPTGWTCSPDVQSACTWPYGACVDVGDFTTTHYQCTSGGSCGSWVQYGTCLRSTNGNSCGPCNTCVNGSCVEGC